MATQLEVIWNENLGWLRLEFKSYRRIEDHSVSVFSSVQNNEPKSTWAFEA